MTGTDVDADTWSGIETPSELGSSIVDLNGGSNSNNLNMPLAPGQQSISSN